MVYRRGYRGRRRGLRRRFRGRSRVRAMKRIARKVVRANIETKMLETALSGTFGSVSTTATSMNFWPVNGQNYNQKVGREIHPTYFKLRGLLHGGQSNFATDDSHNIFRVLLVSAEYDWAPTNVQTNNYIDPGKGLFRKVNKVYYDHTFALNSPGRDSTGYLAVQKEINIKRSLRSMGKMTFDDSGNPERLLFLVMVSDSALPVNPGFTDGQARFYFKDG